MKVGIIRCQARSMQCSANHCLRAAGRGTGEWGKYGKIEIVGIDTCGGCWHGTAKRVLENAEIFLLDNDLVDQIFDFMVRDLSGFALKLYSQPSTTQEQMTFCLKMIKRPDVNYDRFNQVWSNQVLSLRDAYEMNP